MYIGIDVISSTNLCKQARVNFFKHNNIYSLEQLISAYFTKLQEKSNSSLLLK